MKLTNTLRFTLLIALAVFIFSLSVTATPQYDENIYASQADSVSTETPSSPAASAADCDGAVITVQSLVPARRQDQLGHSS